MKQNIGCILNFFRTRLFSAVLYLIAPHLICSSVNADQLVPRNSAEISASSIGMQTIWLDLGPIRKDVTRKMFDNGIKWCRIGVPWAFVEHDSISHYDFSTIDTIVQQLTNHSIIPYLILSGPNTLYDPNGYPPIPDSVAYFNAWLAYVDTLIKRYQDKVNYWEIWNEPNLDESWPPAANPLQYSALACSTTKAIRAIDTDAVICLGGTALVDIKFIKSCLENGVDNYVNRIGIHPYRTLPEAPQSLLVWTPNSQFISPFGSYEEEIRALKDTLALYNDSLEIWDTEGCYLSDSIYPDPLSPDPFNPQHSSETTQAKYLARRFILNLKQSIEVSTWTVMWDLHSLTNNMGRTDWVDDYTERTDFTFAEAPFCGVIYTPQNMYTFTLEGERYDAIFPPMETLYDVFASGDSCVWTPNGVGDSGSVYYDFDLVESGWYTFWSRSVGNGDSISLFIAAMDTIWFSIGNWYSTSEYRWIPLTGEFVRFLKLDPDSHSLFVETYWDGSRFDIWKLVKVDSICDRKESYYTLQNICSVFDEVIRSTASFSSYFENINADTASYNKLVYANFEDTASEGRFIAYWFGVEAEDNYGEKLLRLMVNDTTVSSAVLINFVNGSVDSIGFFISDTLTVFDSLPVADFPYCIAFNWSQGIKENEKFKEQSWKLEICPNPFTGKTVIKFSSLVNAEETNDQSAITSNVQHTVLKIYDLSGRLTKTLPISNNQSLRAKVVWDGTDSRGNKVAAGIYFCKLEHGDIKIVKKLIFLR